MKTLSKIGFKASNLVTVVAIWFLRATLVLNACLVLMIKYSVSNNNVEAIQFLKANPNLSLAWSDFFIDLSLVGFSFIAHKKFEFKESSKENLKAILNKVLTILVLLLAYKVHLKYMLGV